MPAPINPNFNPPANYWEGNQFKMPPGVLQLLAQRQGGIQGGPQVGMAPPPPKGVLGSFSQTPPNPSAVGMPGMGLLSSLLMSRKFNQDQY